MNIYRRSYSSKIEDKHSKEAIFYALACGFEKAAYYGIRSIWILFVFKEINNSEDSNVFFILGYFSLMFSVARFLGALLGDLIIGNKKLILIGIVLSIIGYALLCFQTETFIYVGWGIAILGSGLFSSNIMAEFGKSYLPVPRLLDAGFTLYNAAVNIGAALGIILIGYLSDINYTYAFVFGVVIMLATLAFILLAKKEVKNVEGAHHLLHKIEVKKGRIYIVLAILLTGLFWMVYQLSINNIQNAGKNILKGFEFIPESILNAGFDSYFVFAVTLILVLLWTHIYTNSFFKLFIGFMFAVGALAVLFFTPETGSSLSVTLFILAMLFLSIGESLITPILNSIVTRFAKPKYLAITLMVVALPGELFNALSGYLSEYLTDVNPKYIYTGGTFVLLILGVVAFILSKTYVENRIHLSKEAEEFLA